ncbi:MAG TPA: response regulator [Rhodocyclaceae bacterium]|nr:response regulator [Rhodocyclaceae bacterium]
MSIPTQLKRKGLDYNTRVLVVDDFETMCRVTAEQLRQAGVEQVVTASNGAEALQLLQGARFDIVLSDWNMAVMNGLELLRAMRADPALSALPFMLITEETERHKVREAIACGVTSLLLKPYSPLQLIARVDEALRRTPRRPAPQAVAATVAAAAQPVASAVLQQSPDDDRLTVLVVDDTPDNLVLLSGLFRDEYRVRLAHNAEKALQYVTSNDPPDLVLLDIMMPGMDGFELARHMREHPAASTIPIIFVTALGGADARLQGLELGAVDYVTKPIDPATLKPRVRNFMRYVQQRKDLQAQYDESIEAAQLRDDVERITRHDVRGPLTSVLGVLKTLLEDDLLERRQLEQLRLAEEITLHALGMINQSAELYRIERGQFELKAEPVAIVELLRRIADAAHITWAERRLSIPVDIAAPLGSMYPRALADATLCFSVFQNLIQNACEAAPAGSKVEVKLLDQDPLVIVIENKGTVPAAIRACFFEKFATAGKAGGAGLGTYSARLLVEAQHGEIGMETNDERNWTRVTVSLPRAR